MKKFALAVMMIAWLALSACAVEGGGLSQTSVASSIGTTGVITIQGLTEGIAIPSGLRAVTATAYEPSGGFKTAVFVLVTGQTSIAIPASISGSRYIELSADIPFNAGTTNYLHLIATNKNGAIRLSVPVTIYVTASVAASSSAAASSISSGQSSSAASSAVASSAGISSAAYSSEAISSATSSLAASSADASSITPSSPMASSEASSIPASSATPSSEAASSAPSSSEVASSIASSIAVSSLEASSVSPSSTPASSEAPSSAAASSAPASSVTPSSVAISSSATVSSSAAASSSNGDPYKPYSTNPTYGKAVSTPIVIDGTNTSGEWSDSALIALDMAGDDGRTFGCWMMHEAPVIDFTHLYAAWDDNNLYIAIQVFNTTKEIDSANFNTRAWNSADGSGILGAVLVDTDPAQGSSNVSWGIVNQFNGPDKPDYEILFHGDLSQDKGFGKVSNNQFYYAPMGVLFWQNFTTIGGAIAVGNTCVPSHVWGVQVNDDISNAMTNGPKLVDYIAGFDRNGVQKHTDFSTDCFYEIKMPLSNLGITRQYLENTGIGIFVATGGRNDTIPHDWSTLDSPGSINGNAELLENGKDGGDKYTAPFARIGHAK